MTTAVMSAGRWAVVAAIMLLGACAEREVILPGERLDLRDGLSAPRQMPETPPAFQVPAARANADWAQGVAPVANAALAPAPALIWSADIGQGNDRRHRITARPVVLDQRIFTMDSRATVTALGLNGAVLWTRDLTPAGERADDAGGGGLAAQGGTVYASSGFGSLVALDATSGEILWRQRFEAPSSGAPAVEGDRVFVVTRDGQGYGLRRSDGRIMWQITAQPGGAGIVGGAAPAIAGDAVVLPFTSGEIVSASVATGARSWVGAVAGQRLGVTAARISDITGDPVITGGAVVAGNHSGRIVSFDLADGTRNWTAREGAVGAPWAAGGSLFAVSDRNQLLRLDAGSGALLWAVDLPLYVDDRPRRRKGVFAHYGPILAAGRLILASDDGILRFFDPQDGAALGAIDLPEGATAMPVVAGGVLYVLGEGGRLHAFR